MRCARSSCRRTNDFNRQERKERQGLCIVAKVTSLKNALAGVSPAGTLAMSRGINLAFLNETWRLGYLAVQF
jgi:hypothetical protein